MSYDLPDLLQTIKDLQERIKILEERQFSVINGNVYLGDGAIILDANNERIQVGGTNVLIDGLNSRIILNDGSNDRVLLGYLSGGF